MIIPQILKRWEYFCKQGIKKEDYEKLKKKYECIKELDSPKLNPQIASTMKEIAITRDNHMVDTQRMAGTALSILGSLLSRIYNSKDEGLELESLCLGISDAAKFLTAIVYKQSNARKAFIEPGLTKETRSILKNTSIDELLYGSDLGEKIKEAKALDKMGKDLKLQPSTSTNNSTQKKNLNIKSPFVQRRPATDQMGYMNSTGRLKQRLYLKNKQQFINHRAQMNFRLKNFQKPEKKN